VAEFILVHVVIELEGVDVMKLVLNHIIYNHNNNFSSKSDFYL
jgi:hypothetical protein